MRAITKLVAQARDLRRASWLITKAEAMACTVTNPDHQVRTLAELANAAAKAGDLNRAGGRESAADRAARARGRLVSRAYGVLGKGMHGGPAWPGLRPH